eukprot:TRINITY_DN27291_c0_g1_i3.p1 TRINITY_DN27291_c0_g1~~TRINITY_DN27291_c0_g1_i3.p1  ORF type:complete len:605 (+),score=87.51 TRINITY_DN27291_c0_g1_i3:105-1919(+)
MVACISTVERALTSPRAATTNSEGKATPCIWCPIGSFSAPDASFKAYVCEACPGGKFGGSVGATTCADCPRGGFSGEGRSACDGCSPGTYSDVEGAAHCLPCPAGFVTDGFGAADVSDCICRKGFYPSGDGGGGARCTACGLYLTTDSDGAPTQEFCVVDGSSVAFHAAVVSAFGALLAALCCWRRYKDHQTRQIMKRALKQGFAAISSPQYPMCLISLRDFVSFSTEEVERCYEGARDEGQLLFLDSLEDITDFQASGRSILFLSYNWPSWSRLGPNEKQLSCMQAAAQQICTNAGVEPESFFVWLDVLSIPQAHDGCKALAVASLYVYASHADYMCVVCPRVCHEDTDEVLGVQSVKSRLWCRVEQVAHCCNNGFSGMYACMSEGEVTPLSEDWIRDVVRIFDGNLTCCRQGHVQAAHCDRELLVPTVLAMYANMLWKQQQGRLAQDALTVLWPIIRENRDAIFPKTFAYKSCDTKSSRRLLFGSMMDTVEHFVAKQASSGGSSLRFTEFAQADAPRTKHDSGSSAASAASDATLRQRVGKSFGLSFVSRLDSSLSLGSECCELQRGDSCRSLRSMHSRAQLRRLSVASETSTSEPTQLCSI